MNTTTRSALAALLSVVLATSVCAQTPQPSPAFLAEPPAGGQSATALVGLDVIGMDHERIGRTEDVVIDSDGRVRAVVISVGGFLGIGKKQVAVPFDQLVWVPEDVAPASQVRSNTVAGNAPSGEAANTAGPATMPGAQVSNEVLASVDEKRGGVVSDATGSVVAKDQSRGQATTSAAASPNRLIRAEARLTRAMLEAAPAYAPRAEAAR
ncbi:MAG: PRC-barrel domain-containing protein [Methylobacterium sp.]|uniref:PRC-barrel domain-containing protein n=1 Tax=Methylobacterium sp. TaxID=409 RepID=UPI0025E0F748|nr:PRC-barrel domain-containing protein [Methylobacterium sp.]MBX9932714.1 PRC-barrel domain-containing protein [Methylobacterium sp.]